VPDYKDIDPLLKNREVTIIEDRLIIGNSTEPNTVPPLLLESHILPTHPPLKNLLEYSDNLEDTFKKCKLTVEGRNDFVEKLHLAIEQSAVTVADLWVLTKAGITTPRSFAWAILTSNPDPCSIVLSFRCVTRQSTRVSPM